ncbi:LysR family transcriptional regulator [Paraburkholderia kirstenboschensis]|uniref:LysR family transcriptional regulator n=1 Tax=Paraburkholderia kirstenboschensis TaxID=1245436 RepID=A0ABZ0EAN4_9BURK|nr:LysR family transcriptional regulator [Paraburkholderia kirstenboschensis]WOD14306.1 LysR family transcriptional regulator [Paraburkholderia kirstenboschensis]
MRFDIETLRLFIFTIEGGSISAASERGSVVVSAVSRRISELERAAGTPLLHRRSRGVEPTPAGLALYRRAKIVMGNLQEIENEMGRHRDGVRGLVRLSVNLTAMAHYLPKALKSFVDRFPEVQIGLVERLSDQVSRDVLSGDADVGICAASGIDESLSERPFRTDRLVLITPADHPLGRRESVKFAETLDYEHVGMQDGASILALATQAAKAVGRPMRLAIQVTNFEAIRNMVIAGLGIAIIPEIALAERDHADYVKVRLDEQWAGRQLKLLFKPTAPLPIAAMHLLDHLCTKGGKPETGSDPMV